MSIKQEMRPKIRRQELSEDCRISVKDVLAGLHHEYSLESEAD